MKPLAFSKFKKHELRLEWILLLILGIRGLSLFFQPLHWGLMDDAGRLTEYAGLSFGEMLTAAKVSFIQSLDWGLFRPTYHLWIFLAYAIIPEILGLPPQVVFFLCFLIYAVTGLLFMRIFDSFFDKDDAQTRSALRVVFLAAYLSFTPGLNLINLVSLQEKLALLGFAVSGVLLLSNRKLYDVFAVVALLAAFGSKPTIVAFVPILLAIIIVHRGWKKGRAIASFFTALTVFWIALAAYFANRGMYTQRYGESTDVISQYFSFGGPWAILFVGLAAFSLCALAFQKARWKYYSWWVAWLAFMVLMLPWGIFGYLWSLLLPVFAALCALSAWPALRSKVFPYALLYGCIVPVCFSQGPKLQILLNRQIEIGEVVEWLKADDMKPYQVFLAAPCSEGSGAMTDYTGKEIEMWKDDTERKLQPQSAVLVGTWWECPELPRIQVGTFEKFGEDWNHWSFYQLKR